MNLEKENKLLRALLRDLTTLLNELFAVMPPDVQGLEQTKDLLIILNKIKIYLNNLEQERGPALSAPDNRSEPPLQ